MPKLKHNGFLLVSPISKNETSTDKLKKINGDKMFFAKKDGKEEKKIGFKHVPYQYTKLNGHVCNNCGNFTSIENDEVVHRCNILNKEISWPFDYTCDKGIFGMDWVHNKLNE